MGKKTLPRAQTVPGGILVTIVSELRERVKNFFNKCLQTRIFPKVWETANLVLIPTTGKKDICLLNEMGTLLERIIANKISTQLSGPDISDDQFGFRVERSTIDGIDRVVTLAQSAVSQRGVALAVLIDNAFNSLS